MPCKTGYSANISVVLYPSICLSIVMLIDHTFIYIECHVDGGTALIIPLIVPPDEEEACYKGRRSCFDDINVFVGSDDSLKKDSGLFHLRISISLASHT